MRPVSNQPDRFFATAETHKFTLLNDITVENFKLRPIIHLTETYTYNTSKVIANYLWSISKNQYTISDTLKFPDLLKSADPNVNYEDVSYDVESLFTCIPVAETIEYILKGIYTNKVLKPLCKKSIFKKSLIKLTKKSVFSASNRLIKQIDGYPMGGPISVVSSDIYMCKMEEDVVKSLKPIFYKRYVDDTYVKRKRNESDTLFDVLNSYHPNIKFTLEQNPKRFLDTQIIKENNQIKTQVFVKKSMYLVHWPLKVPFRYKKNAINGQLRRAKKISSNFQSELKQSF